MQPHFKHRTPQAKTAAVAHMQGARREGMAAPFLAEDNAADGLQMRFLRLATHFGAAGGLKLFGSNNRRQITNGLVEIAIQHQIVVLIP